MSHVVALAIVNRENQPVFFKVASHLDEAESNKLVCLLYSSLDFIDEKQSQAGSRDPYLGLLSQLDNLKVYGLLSTTKAKVILILTTATGSPPLRDTEVRNMVKQVYSAYVDATTCNPFYFGIPGQGSIKSKAFDSVIQAVFCK